MKRVECFDIWNYSWFYNQLNYFTSDFIKGNIDLIKILNGLEFTNTEGQNPDSGILFNLLHGRLDAYFQIEMLYVELTELNDTLLSSLFNNINSYSDMFTGWTGVQHNIDLLHVIEIAPYLGYGVVHYNENGFYISNSETYRCSNHFEEWYDHIPYWIYPYPSLIEYSCTEDPSKEDDLPF
ncbi:hypothetical protein HMPREF9711_03148 [Myroides odoratimimus CCUG 3837]|uniref:hypothetical protein n=1 Tax=Myroides odoratimimus TaxID=76832 RepID=UPI000280ACF3|nr:hypothetical protein [Myroides odoratimimus]EKB02363.1 hypothetical protein HMPREF9711_03148 [Myroides odoratimimus CCUG 3837]